jgi:hypothetical protein
MDRLQFARPGVTLLELLCYGLTDLVYRTDFDVSDFYADRTAVSITKP